MMKSTAHILKLILKLLVGFGLAGYLIVRLVHKNFPGTDPWHRLVGKITGLDPIWGTLGFVTFGIIMMLTFLRWRLLLRVQGVDVPLNKLLQLGMIGCFFNACLPGAVTGDLVKMVYIRRHAEKRTAEAILTIMLDRIIGVFGLLLLATLLLMMNTSFVFSGSDRMKQIALFIVITFVIGTGGLGGMFLQRKLMQIPGVTPCVNLAVKLLPQRLTDIFRRLSYALDLYHDKPAILAGSVAFSLLVHIFNGLILYAFLLALHVSPASILWVFFTIQVSNIAGSVPLFPGGVGLRDTVTSFLLAQIGIGEQTATTAAILFTLGMTAWNLLGGLFFILHRNEIQELEPPSPSSPIATEPSPSSPPSHS